MCRSYRQKQSGVTSPVAQSCQSSRSCVWMLPALLHVPTGKSNRHVCTRACCTFKRIKLTAADLNFECVQGSAVACTSGHAMEV